MQQKFEAYKAEVDARFSAAVKAAVEQAIATGKPSPSSSVSMHS
jgi:hypothetical protein